LPGCAEKDAESFEVSCDRVGHRPDKTIVASSTCAKITASLINGGSAAQNHSLLLRYDPRKLASVYLTNDREPPWACNLQARKQSIRRWTLPWAESVGNGGMMLDPTREVDWVECILKTAQRGGERDLMIDRGLERVRFVFMEKHRGRASGRLSSSGLIWIGSL
jgi:hypothetical protein